MIKWTLGLASVLLSTTAFGSSERLNRVNEIWDIANSRIATQIDVWFEEGDYPAIIQLLKVQGEIYPANYDIWTNLGWMQENVHEWEAALATYEAFQANNPKDPDSRLPAGTFFFNRKEFAKVIPVLTPTIGTKCHPNNYRLLARAYEKLGQLEESKATLEALLKVFPSDLQAVNNLKRVNGKLAAKKPVAAP